MITTIFNPPTPADSVSDIEDKSYDTFIKLNAFGSEANQTAEDVNDDAQSALVSKNSAASSATAAGNASAAALQSEQASETNKTLAQTAATTAQEARDAAILAASDVGALVLTDAQKILQRNKTDFFGLNLRTTL
ncbi:MAG: hypothetical protein COW76_05145 [Shewanella sp. CG18_big_fil_WC_8_21_14_2_50_42_11]|uniref:hypothetical protein n=1 Tax=Shewanella sp. CG18_big_fil_WC_8_21_14_2_50_42_11 TaxID=1975538 RepID=UPI000C4E9A00|nr:hypothetical protein [Shewanella sp. CG18_big_fil_WC_8_21_14_2_50_42_11]PIQ01473.1 MAG: hypothetical protein COW76_05145 [Shewanella sp. CG18_big_fil_WC_8_21_14_2_50_42_11]